MELDEEGGDMSSRCSTLSGSVSANVSPPAFSAHSIAPWCDVGVLGSKSVAVVADLLRCIDGSLVIRPEHIFSGGDRANVINVDALFGVAAVVIELLPGWNRTVSLIPDPGMACDSFALGEKFRISAMVQGFGPQMTSGLGIDDVAGLESSEVISSDDVDDEWIAMSGVSAVVHAAPSLAICRLGAIIDRAVAGDHDMTPYQQCETEVAA